MWHEIVEARDAKRLGDVLADGVVFHSPVVHTPQVGKAITMKYLRAAMEVLGAPDFHYVEEWHGERSAVLEFSMTLDGKALNGVDIIHWNESGRITNFRVMVRPVKALMALMPAMAAVLEQA